MRNHILQHFSKFRVLLIHTLPHLTDWVIVGSLWPLYAVDAIANCVTMLTHFWYTESPSLHFVTLCCMHCVCADKCRESIEMELYDLAKSVGADWEQLAISLGLNDVEMKVIEADVPTTIDRSYKMLREWYWYKGSQVTIGDVAIKIEEIRRQKKAVAKSGML